MENKIKINLSYSVEKEEVIEFDTEGLLNELIEYFKEYDYIDLVFDDVRDFLHETIVDIAMDNFNPEGFEIEGLSYHDGELEEVYKSLEPQLRKRLENLGIRKFEEIPSTQEKAKLEEEIELLEKQLKAKKQELKSFIID